jgi:hypothetical protein
VYCTGAEWREDVEAAIEFLKLRVEEERRLGLTAQRIDGTTGMIKRLESLHSQGASK